MFTLTLALADPRAMPRDHRTPLAVVRGARRLPRLKTELITCELGEVTNLSMLGLCVRNDQLNTGDEHTIIVEGFEMTAGPLQATVIWVKDGDAGLKFTKAAKTVRKSLSDLAMLARERGSFLTIPAKSRRKT